jgi:polyphosphate kinase 2 (PPK2 family)
VIFVGRDSVGKGGVITRNRAGDERVMGFATPEQVKQIFHDVPEFDGSIRHYFHQVLVFHH